MEGTVLKKKQPKKYANTARLTGAFPPKKSKEMVQGKNQGEKRQKPKISDGGRQGTTLKGSNSSANSNLTQKEKDRGKNNTIHWLPAPSTDSKCPPPVNSDWLLTAFLVYTTCLCYSPHTKYKNFIMLFGITKGEERLKCEITV